MYRGFYISRRSDAAHGLFALCVLTVILAADAAADGGYTRPSSPRLTSVKEIQARPHSDVQVGISGKITAYLGYGGKYDQLYRFADSTGDIYVSLPDSIWMGQRISEKDNVEISGAVVPYSDDFVKTVENISGASGIIPGGYQQGKWIRGSRVIKR